MTQFDSDTSYVDNKIVPYTKPVTERHSVWPVPDKTRSWRVTARSFAGRRGGERGRRIAEQLLGQSEDDRRMQYQLQMQGLPTVASFGRDRHEAPYHRPFGERVRKPADLGTLDVVAAGATLGASMAPGLLSRAATAVVPATTKTTAVTKPKETVDLARRKFLTDARTLVTGQFLPGVGKRVTESLFTEGVRGVAESLLSKEEVPDIGKEVPDIGNELVTAIINEAKEWLPSTTRTVGNHWLFSMESADPFFGRGPGPRRGSKPIYPDSPGFSEALNRERKKLERAGIKPRPEDDAFLTRKLKHLDMDEDLEDSLSFRRIITEDWNYKEGVDQENLLRFKSMKAEYDLVMRAGREFFDRHYGLKVDDIAALLPGRTHGLEQLKLRPDLLSEWRHPEAVSGSSAEPSDDEAHGYSFLGEDVSMAIDKMLNPDEVDYREETPMRTGEHGMGESFLDSRDLIGTKIQDAISKYIETRGDHVMTFENEYGMQLNLWRVRGIPMGTLYETGKDIHSYDDPLYENPIVLYPNNAGLEKIIEGATAWHPDIQDKLPGIKRPSGTLSGEDVFIVNRDMKDYRSVPGVQTRTAEIFTNPEYYREEKDRVAEVVSMTPAEYIKRAAQILNISDKEARRQRRFDSDYNLGMQEAMEEGQKFGAPYLDYGTIQQEGLNRAISAEQLGIKEIPVVVITRVADQAKILAEIARKK